MISTKEIVENIVRSSPLVEEGLARGIISYSALAREIRPAIEKKLMKEVSRGAIVMALKRVSKNLKSKRKNLQNNVIFKGITVRSNLSEITYINSNTIAEKYDQVFSLCAKRKDIFWNLSQGIRETMLLVSQEVEEEIERIFQNEKKIARIEKLASITILLTEEIVNTPGAYYAILKLFAWNDINLVDVISTYTEITIIFYNQDIDKAFSILRNYQSKGN